MKILENCTICPRKCGINRYEQKGFCGEMAEIHIARADLHFWEEPCISGKDGSGTIFFSGCCLKCCFCQNYEISAEHKGFTISVEELAQIFLDLQNKGANNINLVTPTHFTPQIIKAVDIVKNNLHIPIIYNCSGYENIETLEMLNGKISIFLPDLKYYDSDLSYSLSTTRDYFEVASKSISRMVEMVGKPKFDNNGIIQSGVIIRHLVLPGQRKDSAKIIQWLKENFSTDEILISLMSQYTPISNNLKLHELNRKLSTFEYNYVAEILMNSGFDGFIQEKSSSNTNYIPKFYGKKYF